MKFLVTFGRYVCFVGKMFSRPERFKIYAKNFIMELDNLGLSSIFLVTIISFFIGAVVTLQGANNMSSPLLPKALIGFLTRQTLLLEFSSTIVSLILAGKIGSNIASEIGTMRITEQIEAMETMGVNSVSYLVTPKVVAAMFINPILFVFSAFIGLIGGLVGGLSAGVVGVGDYIQGLNMDFRVFDIIYSMVKCVFFAFIYTTVPAFYGYYVQGGALEVGKASTKAVVDSSIIILMVNLIITQIML